MIPRNNIVDMRNLESFLKVRPHGKPKKGIDFSKYNTSYTYQFDKEKKQMVYSTENQSL